MGRERWLSAFSFLATWKNEQETSRDVRVFCHMHLKKTLA